ncbi:MAG: DUF4402 domain-containing protein [Bacteroidales bacterium]|nr:DUF4402 domain-containing protein [Bacteroidales bacterium]
MKNLIKFFAITIVMFSFAASTFAQGVSATANASATIITPLAITKTADLSFGNISVGALSGGTIIISSANARTATGTCSFQVTPASTVATFDLTGASGANMAITLPVSSTIANGGNTMTLNTFTSDAPATITGGAVTFHVGATLNVSAGQVAGPYTGTFDVTANYN